MPKKASTDLEKVTVRLHAGDKDALTKYYPMAGYNKAIRALIHQHVKALRARNEQETQHNDRPNIDIDLGD